MSWQLCELDKEIFARELDSFVPQRIYDVHGHLYRVSFWPVPPPRESSGPADITLEVYREQMAWLFPGREVHGMHFPLAFVEDTGPGNAWIRQEIAKDSLARGQLLVRPTDDPEWVRQEVKKLGLRGLKPFSTYAEVENKWEAELPTYLPEAIAKVASEEGWTVTLHLVRSRGVADESNQYWIRHYCQNYPGMQLILDHAARGFNPYHALEGLAELKGLDNLWIDTSVQCHPLAIEAALRIMGPQKVLYGSDYCISHFRGVNFSVGDTFMWLYENDPAFVDAAYRAGADRIEPALIGIENLRAIKAACWSAGLSDSDVENVFWGNAAKLVGVE